MNYIFGPVPTRRLGQSLGIDPVPLKTCNWNCVYCQLGRSIPMVNKRKEYYPADEILAEAKNALLSHQPGEIDWVTFVGSGETTLHASLGWLLREVKKITGLPVAVITNGSLLYLPEVRRELLAADAVLPSLDAGTPELYQHINRPYPGLSFESFLDGLISFSEEYQGNLWVEVMLVKDLNDTEDQLNKIASALQRIKPDEIHIMQPTRPPVETWVKPPSDDGLRRALDILGDTARVIHPASGSYDLGEAKSIVEAVVGIVTRHPMREKELVETLKNLTTRDVTETLSTLAESDKLQVVERNGIRYWSASPSYYPEDKHNQ
ncbi:MAG: radical SAM protein [Anaerolineales bacterium]|nr:radical SAM protein [Anaerolineales bacterium]